MKAGIITFHRAVNYGAVLQAYALRQALAPADIIDYRNPLIEKAYSALRPPRPFSPRGLLAYMANIPIKLKKNRSFRRFLRRFVGVGEGPVGEKELAALNGRYGVFVTGSDQVWNHGRSGFDKAYFLGFAQDGKKASYAASFGFASLEPEYVRPYRELLRGFGAISVREARGAGIVEDLLGAPAQVVLDPTLLLDRDGWAEVGGASSLRAPERYILLYVFELTPGVRAFTEKLSEETGLPVVWVQAALSQRLPRAKKLYTASPEDFISLFLRESAEYVVTNSFHGTAFSINFNKPFFVEMLSGQEGLNTRVADLLALFGLEDRLIGKCGAGDGIDYGAVNEKLRAERERSFAFLQKIGGERHH